jgi:hypothetical protein
VLDAFFWGRPVEGVLTGPMVVAGSAASLALSAI